MKILILPDAAAAAARAADVLAATIAAGPRCVLGLATGGTMEPVYRALRLRFAEGALSFAGVTSFNLDEYLGLSRQHPNSYRMAMRGLLFDHVDIDPAHAHLPRGDAPDPAAEADRYESAIAAAGGIDLQLLGIGANGHIGFNEPISSLASRTRVKTLSAATREANRRFFPADEPVPLHAITMGIATVLSARRLLLLATGRNKAEAVARAVEGPLAAACPASALQLHPAATLVLDAEAASLLRLRSYYETVHPGGTEPPL